MLRSHGRYDARDATTTSGGVGWEEKRPCLADVVHQPHQKLYDSVNRTLTTCFVLVRVDVPPSMYRIVCGCQDNGMRECARSNGLVSVRIRFIWSRGLHEQECVFTLLTAVQRLKYRGAASFPEAI